MDYKEVEQLLDKFYNAHTTCPEEQKLYDWLCSEECSEELFIDREIIRTYIQQHPPVDIPKDIELKMEVLIDNGLIQNINLFARRYTRNGNT